VIIVIGVKSFYLQGIIIDPGIISTELDLPGMPSGCLFCINVFVEASAILVLQAVLNRARAAITIMSLFTGVYECMQLKILKTTLILF